MSGMKNYLVKHGERGFEKEVEKERLKVSLLKIYKIARSINFLFFYTY
jgi:hypothetical protein